VTDSDLYIVGNDLVGNYMATKYTKYAKTHKIVKFVPASGAATRMSQDLYDYLKSGNINQTVLKTVEHISDFAFYNDLKKYISADSGYTDIVKSIVSEPGLNYGNTAKGLISFHKYGNYAKTPVEEHMVEGAEYAMSGDTVNIHFTVSPEYRKAFETLLKRIVPIYELKYCVKYKIEISEQKPSTDTIAVNKDNTVFRNLDGSLLLRPAGHGALIENLNDIDADIIFIKNIDNVQPDNLRKDTIKYKKMLAGILVHKQQQIFDFIRQIDARTANISEIHKFIESNLGLKLSHKLSADEYKQILNRPIRVCGIVKNIGAPGGGPFWVRDKDGNTSLQIVESSQISPESRDIMNKSEYFNPVDLVCGIRDYNGKKFDLTKYIDKNTGFISEKSKDGAKLLAMERPGLWNGAMANWITIFVPVPASTFTPVKSIADLLLKEHQPR